MNSVLLGFEEEAGFDFRNCRRNENLIKNGFKPSETTKSGTTICGVVFKGGVVLGADSRATGGSIVVDKGCKKLYHIQDNIYCCGAGTAADMHKSASYVSANMELIRQNTNRKFVPVKAAVHFAKQYLYPYQGKISSYLVFGGVDNDGPHIHSVHGYGSSDRVPYESLGSGSLAAMTVFESRWKPDMTESEAIKLVRDAVASGIYNDLGSGSNVDLVVIKKNYHKKMHGYEIAAQKGERKGDYSFKRGTTGIKSYKTFDIEVVEENVVFKHEKMDVE